MKVAHPLCMLSILLLLGFLEFTHCGTGEVVAQEFLANTKGIELFEYEQDGPFLFLMSNVGYRGGVISVKDLDGILAHEKQVGDNTFQYNTAGKKEFLKVDRKMGQQVYPEVRSMSPKLFERVRQLKKSMNKYEITEMKADVISSLAQRKRKRQVSGEPFHIFQVRDFYLNDRRPSIEIIPESSFDRIRALFKGVKNEADERQAIAKATKLFEQFTSLKDDIGGWPGNRVSAKNKRQIVTTCEDEANTYTKFLRRLEQMKLIRAHTVIPALCLRHNESGNRPGLEQHVAALIQSKSGTLYAVDSWLKDGGNAALIQKLEDWQKDGVRRQTALQ